LAIDSRKTDRRKVDPRKIEGAYLRDLLDQPQALQNTFQNLEDSKELSSLAERLHRGEFQRIVLTGMGSSFHALHPLNLQLIGNGFAAIMVETSELIHYQERLFNPQTLIIAVSQSGRSVEMLRLLEVNEGRSALIAVTNTPDSPLRKQATAAVLTHAGSEFSVSCKTYVAALMALKWLGDILCLREMSHSRGELENATPAAATYLTRWKEYVSILAENFDGMRHLFLVGRGASLAAVGTGALIIKESAHFHAEGMSSAAFRHGPFEMLGKETFVVVFSGDVRTRELNQRLLADIRQAGGRAELLGAPASLDCFRLPDHKSILPILEILPIQMITLALASLAGREPGRFDRAAKITTTE
jgi:glucosamine--fructose-6-phosphate aminotransferase (isomerizing)